jgi:hypothetical protein
MPEFLTKVQFDVPGAGPLNTASFILGMISMGVLVSLLTYPLVHLFAVLLPQHLPARRLSKKDARALNRADSAGRNCGS